MPMYKVNDQVSVQFGMRSDMVGYAPNIPCIIRAIKPVNHSTGVFEDKYLVQKTFDNECIGIAIVPHKQIASITKGQLICSEFIYYGSKTQDKTLGSFEDAKKRLGFK